MGKQEKEEKKEKEKKERYARVDATIYTTHQPFVYMENVYIVCKDGSPQQAVEYRGQLRYQQYLSVAQMLCGIVTRETGWNCEVILMPKAFRKYSCTMYL